MAVPSEHPGLPLNFQRPLHKEASNTKLQPSLLLQPPEVLNQEALGGSPFYFPLKAFIEPLPLDSITSSNELPFIAFSPIPQSH